MNLIEEIQMRIEWLAIELDDDSLSEADRADLLDDKERLEAQLAKVMLGYPNA